MKYLWATIAFFLSSGRYALASGLTEASWSDLRFRLINFALFATILIWLLAKRIAKYYAARKQKIVDTLAELEDARKAAEARLQEVERQIAHLSEEGEAILKDYREQGENIKGAIIARAEETARHITTQAQFAMENEAKMATENLRIAVADLVIEATEEMLKEQLGPQEHEKLIDKYLDKVVLN